MFSKSFIAFIALSVLSVTEPALGREKWLVRDNKAVFLYPRRFDQQNPAVLTNLSSACPGQVCGNLAGSAVSTLLANAAECDQQNMADQIIDASKQFDAATQANMVAIAVEFRQAEKNTPSDFTTNPPTNRNSVFCQTAPKNPELNGLVQAQDPANDPNVFFDPAEQKSVTKGSQANTFPFGTSGSAVSASSSATSSPVAAPSSAAVSAAAAPTAPSNNAANLAVSDASCSVPVTLTVTVADAATASATDISAVTVTAGDATATSAAAVASTTASSSSIGNFGSCSVPQIKFGVGFDNRKETSYEPVDQVSYNHGSADNIDIITQFICNTLTNTCNADATAKATCATATKAADGQTPKTGNQADAFNAVFGIKTDFAAVQEVDDQGNVVAGTGSGAVSSAAVPAAVASTTAAVSATATSAAPPASTSAAASGSSAIGNFGSCSVPQIKFGVGFDGRKETAFEPVDQVSYNHGSADNIAVITQFICNTLTNTCGADATAKATCASATTAANAETPLTGSQADAFNGVFGIKTDFAAVQEVDNTGKVVAGTGSSASAPPAASSVAVTPAVTSSVASAAVTSPAAAATTTTATTSTAGNLQKFTGDLGGSLPPAVTAIGNGQFQVDGNSAFNDEGDALVRSCDVQHNQCANAANASGNQGALTVAACGDQQTQCNAANGQ